MPTPILNRNITERDGLFVGDHFDVQVNLTAIPTGLTLIKAWWTVKLNLTDADPGIIQKAITTTPVAGVGQITDDGTTDREGDLSFEWVPADTNLFTADIAYWFDVQVQYSNLKVRTFARGRWTAGAAVTQATV